MTREEFIEQKCHYCGTQRCYGEEYCGEFQRKVNGVPLTFTSEEVKHSLEKVGIELVDGELNMEKPEFFEGTKWLVEKREDYWVPNITEKSVVKLPKCAYCGKVFGTVALNYNYCPQCGENMRMTRR